MILDCCEQCPYVDENSVPIQQFECKSCMEYEIKLEALTQEILSSKKIIQLLQEDLKACKDQTSPTTTRHTSVCNATQVSDTANSWKEIVTKSRKTGDPSKTPSYQRPIPVIQTCNRFNTLQNLRSEWKITINGPKLSPGT